MPSKQFPHRITVYEIVPGNWTHTLTEEVWGPSAGGRRAAHDDAWKHRRPGEIIHVEFGLELQQRAKKMNVNLKAKAARRDVLGIPEPPYDPFKLSTGREKDE